jgi:hypothetical protein
VKNKVDDLHLNFRQLDVLMGVIGLGFRKIGISARTALGVEGVLPVSVLNSEAANPV